MRLRAKLSLRNDKMLVARERFGLTQVALAELADVPTSFVGHLEAMNYNEWKSLPRDRDWDQRARRVADALELSVADVCPVELKGQVIETTVWRVAEVDVARLSSVKCLALPGPEEVESTSLRDEARRRIASVLKTLSSREREVLKLRYGFAGGNIYTLKEVGHILKIHKERVRQIERKALGKLQQPSRSSELIGLIEADTEPGNPA